MLARQYFHSSSPLIALSSATTVLLALPPCLLQPGNRPRHPTLRTVVLRTYESDQCLHSSNFIRKYVVTKLRLWPYHGYCSRTPPSIQKFTIKVSFCSFTIPFSDQVLKTLLQKPSSARLPLILGSNLRSSTIKAFFCSFTLIPSYINNKLLYYTDYSLVKSSSTRLHFNQGTSIITTLNPATASAKLTTTSLLAHH